MFIIRPSAHIISTFAISGLVYFVLKSAVSFFASLAAGILIDVDHILDYYIQQGVTLKIKNIYLWAIEKRCELVILCFHYLELLFILWIIISLFKLGIFWTAFAIGITQHMILDLLLNRDINVYGYFLTFRMIKRFRKENIFR